LIDLLLTGLCDWHNVPKFENSELRPEPTSFRAFLVAGVARWLNDFGDAKAWRSACVD
jgi:hypothetical protein